MAALVATAGCTVDSVTEPGPGPDALTSAPAVDADEQLVADVLTELTSAHSVVRRVGHDHPKLQPDLEDLERLHKSHARLLGGLLPAPGSVLTPDEPIEQARERVTAMEERLRRRLVRASVAASSGALASLLASMAAAVAQRQSA